jgi:hypothetical protein
MSPDMNRSIVATLSAMLFLAACGDTSNDGARPQPGSQDQDALPAPQGATGSVTGMPGAPGPGGVPIAGTAPAPSPDGSGEVDPELPPLEDNPETGLLAVDPGAASVPADAGTEAAVAVVRDYYAAINARDFVRAYALWSDGGRSSGQSPRQFSDAFSETAGITVQIGDPSELQGVGGARHVEVPVTLTATRRSGEVRRFLGAYTLRRASVDRADGWRIIAADLRELQP